MILRPSHGQIHTMVECVYIQVWYIQKAFFKAKNPAVDCQELFLNISSLRFNRDMKVFPCCKSTVKLHVNVNEMGPKSV